MPAPTVEPLLFDVADAPASGDYRPGQRVWVYRAGSWRPGVVLHQSEQAVTVRYRPAEGPGTGVDTVTARSLAVREDADPYLDNGPPLRRSA